MNFRRSIFALSFFAILPFIAFVASPTAHAAPKTVGGTFTVNGAGDLATANNFITLREAILLANGGTGGDGTSTGLGRNLTDNEKAQLSGCAFSGSTDNWTITSGCGGGITDTIVFSLSVGVTITLGTASMPVINDSAPTIIDGTAISPTLDTSGVSGSHNGLHISSNNNIIKSLGIANTSLSDFYVAGSANLLEGVWAWNAGANGIYIVGNSNVITHALIGLASFGASSCGANYGNAGSGIYVTGALSNVIGYSVISCNAGDGITLDNFAHGTTVIANEVGGSNLSNNGNGLLITGGAHDNVIGSASSALDGSNVFVDNILDGIMISGTNTATNTLISNYTASNTANGIRIAQGAFNNLLEQGGPSIPVSDLNGLNGILIASGAHDNIINNYQVFSNGRNGIELSGSGTTRNLISAGSYGINALDGINERNGADNNKWTLILTSNNGGLGIDKNAGNDANNNITPPFPVIMTVSCGGGNCTLSGTASVPGTGTTVVEIYAVAVDPSGYGEGKTFLGFVSANSGGNWTTSVSSSSGTCFAAFQTQTTAVGVATSSEFGPNSCRLFLPLIER